MAGGTVRPRDQRNWGALRAIDPMTAERKWEFRYPTDLVVRCVDNGIRAGVCRRRRRQHHGLRIEDAERTSGTISWDPQCGQHVGDDYMLDGRQYLLVPSGTTLTAFALPRAR